MVEFAGLAVLAVDLLRRAIFGDDGQEVVHHFFAGVEQDGVDGVQAVGGDGEQFAQVFFHNSPRGGQGRKALRP